MLDPLDTRTLKAARQAAGISRAELARRASVDETTILRIENGDSDPRLDATWAPIVRALTPRVRRRRMAAAQVAA